MAAPAVSAGPRLVVHHPLPLRPGHVSKCGASRPKPARASTAGRSALLYGKYDAQPQLGFLERREGILGSGSIKLTQNWMANAAVRYDVDAQQLAGTSFGIGYIDDCLIVALNYMTELYL